MAIIVMGVSGSGKSTVGGLLAEQLGCPFLEGDDFHEAAAKAKMHAGQPLTDEDRWPWLDRVGRALGAAVAEQGLAIAACSALRRVYRERLTAASGLPIRFVLLDVHHDALLARLRARQHHYMPASLLGSQLDTLERPEPGECAIVLDATDRPAALLCGEAMAWLRSTKAVAARA